MENALEKVEAKPLEIMDATSPRNALHVASEQAKALLEVAKPVLIAGKKYLQYEAWATLGSFNGVSVMTDDSVPIEVDGIKGFKATATLIDRNGVKVGGATAYCLREGAWKARETFALASMAQTRAGAKALRLKYAFVAQLAGYEGTPAEEITDDMRKEKKIVVKDTEPLKQDMPVEDEKSIDKIAEEMFGGEVEETTESEIPKGYQTIVVEKAIEKSGNKKDGSVWRKMSVLSGGKWYGKFIGEKDVLPESGSVLIAKVVTNDKGYLDIVDIKKEV